MSNDEPLIYTLQGNLPIKDLELHPIWEITDTYIKFTEVYKKDGEVVRSSSHVYDKQGVFAQAKAAEF